MEFYIVAFVGGLVGAIFMDVTEAFMSRLNIRSGVNAAYIGRWFVGFMRGTFSHSGIESVAAVKNEIQIGVWFHFIIGGGVVALVYPFVMGLFGYTGAAEHLLPSLLFGLATSIFPWFILMPSLGWGLFGVQGPAGTRPVLAPMMSHIPYGLGIGLSLTVYYKVFS